MARAHSIRVVRCGEKIVAAFTVKHEMERWLQRQRRYVADALTVEVHRDTPPLPEEVA